MGIPGEPDGGEVAPTELGLNDIPSELEGVADSNSVVAAAAVVLGAFVLRREVAALAPIIVLRPVPHLLPLVRSPPRIDGSRVFGVVRIGNCDLGFGEI